MPKCLSRVQKRIVYILALASVSCSTKECYPEAQYPNYTELQYTTGISDEPQVQQVIENVRECLRPLQQHWLSPEEANDAQCYGKPTFEIRDCLQIALVPEWHISECTGEEVFSCSVPSASCSQKDWLIDAGDCPCSCRAMIQDNTTIWTTPNHKLLPAYLVTMLTGCNNPWTPSLINCSLPK